MKKFLFLILIFCCSLAFGQDQVVTHAQKKSVVLEEFTGIHCVFCPDGHRIAKELKENNPNRVSLINVHAGFFAVPDQGEPDFRVQDGITLDGHFGVTGYPSGTVNRRTFEDENNYSRSLWTQYGTSILSETSPVNLAAQSTYDESTRTLEVTVEVYYALDAENPTNRLILALTQDNVEGPQTGGSNFNPADVLPNGNYRHGHMLRDFLEGPFGMELTETSAGSYFTRTFQYVLPEDIRGIPLLADDCELVVYVAEDEEDIHTGIELGLNDSNNGTTEQVFLAANDFPNNLINSTNSQSAFFSTTFYPFVAGMGDFRIEIETIDSPDDWSWEYSLSDDEIYTENETFSLVEGEVQFFDFNVIPASGGIGSYVIHIIPVDYPNDEVQLAVTVIHDCSELIVNSLQPTKNDASVTANNWGNLYLQAFKDAELENFGAITIDQYDELVKSNQLEGIKNIYYNAGWGVDPLPSTMTLNLLRHNNTGGNIFMCGQDLANDVYSAGSALMQNYLRTNMGTQITSTGGNTNSSVSPVTDGIFDGVGDFTVSDYYNNGIMSPDVLEASSTGENNLSYNGGTSWAGVNKSSSSYKSVFLGFGLEMVDDADARAQIMKNVYNYFYGITDNEENLDKSNLVSVYPNPVVDGSLNIDLGVNEALVKAELVNSIGQTVYNLGQLNQGLNNVQLPLDIQSGVYILRLDFEESTITKSLLIK